MPEPGPARTAGFRFGWADLGALIALGAAGWIGRYRYSSLLWVTPLVMAHCVLFFNLFRVRAGTALIWVVCLGINGFAWRYGGTGPISPWGVLALQAPVTVALVWRELRSARYHGIFAERINNRLDDYLAGANVRDR